MREEDPSRSDAEMTSGFADLTYIELRKSLWTRAPASRLPYRSLRGFLAFRAPTSR
jgi:hypothetical protein